MQTSLITIDDFHPVAKPIAAFAKGLAYGPQEWQGHTYKGLGIGYSPELFYEQLGLVLGRSITPALEFFRLGTKEDAPTTYIHADNACAKNAAVWYLSEAPDGVMAGTAFWKHKETGKYELTAKDREDDDLCKRLDADGADESKWEMVGIAGQRFNRLVVYPSNLFHSRYPKDAWGSCPSDGRITFATFFN